MNEKKAKPPKIKEPKVAKKTIQSSGRGGIALGIAALLLALAGLGGGVFLWITQKNQVALFAREGSAINQKLSDLEEAAALEKNRENVFIQMEPHAPVIYMADSQGLYLTRFSNVRYEGGSVKIRVPLTVTIHNNADQTVTVTEAALYPWETVFDETPRQEALAAKQAKGFFGEVTRGQRNKFSIPPGESVSVEIDARLRGIYTHPALESELHGFFKDYFADPDHVALDPEGDVAVKGKGTMNGPVNYLFSEALGRYCARRSTQFTLTYTITTARENTFSATCAIPF